MKSTVCHSKMRLRLLQKTASRREFRAASSSKTNTSLLFFFACANQINVAAPPRLSLQQIFQRFFRPGVFVVFMHPPVTFKMKIFIFIGSESFKTELDFFTVAKTSHICARCTQVFFSNLTKNLYCKYLWFTIFQPIANMITLSGLRRAC